MEAPSHLSTCTKFAGLLVASVRTGSMPAKGRQSAERKFWSFPAWMENFPCGPQTRTSDNAVSAVPAHSSHTKPLNIALLLEEVSGTKR